MLVKQRLSLLLELLWTDFFSTDSLWNDHRATSNFPEALCKDLCVDNVPLNDFEVVIVSECLVHLTWVDFFRSTNQKPIFIKRHFDDCDVV